MPRATNDRLVIAKIGEPTSLDTLYAGAVDRIPYDPRAARALLTRDGWLPGPDGVRSKNGKQSNLPVLVWNTYGSVAVEVAAQTARLGIRMRVETMTVEREVQPTGPVVRGRVQLELSRFGTPAVSGAYLSCDRRPPNGYNYIGYCKPAVDVLLARATATYDRPARTRYLVEAQRLIANDLPLLGLAQAAELDVMPSDKRGYRPTFSNAEYPDAYRWNIVR